MSTFKQRVQNLTQSSTGAGILLGICVILSLIIANSPLADAFNQLLGTKIGFENNSIHLSYTLKQWIDDGLMAVFFLLVGLEIKKELLTGELSSPKKAALPIFAAMGGAIVPALIYISFNHNEPTNNGWGIPMATDIAFALAVISILGKSVPASLKIFLAALAIVDDLLAILVIAVFYSGSLNYNYLIYAGAILTLLFLFNRFGVRNIWCYLIPGIFIWYFIHHSGIHATIAGVLVAMTIPTKVYANTSALEKIEHGLNIPVNFLIIPLFALVNTNITIHPEMISGLSSPLGLGIMLGLLLGKSFGIFGTCWLCIKLGLSQLPAKATWKHIFGVGLLGGIGFTMSIFISMLSFSDPLFVEEAKFAILIGSLICGLLGYFYLRSLGNRRVF
ncbi:Na+/H+ antiporter NhaA [Sphingobacterium hungaricum]|uniref:Na(+)/H(+) antiporter NhaA n=1 Tax=Sphingobacterium hungaricum TaxID=2082723 RepID=A0A928UXI6_9SPHI|nr:Na+/H+ antiporter NhaA [Sphingobacterium hungaricum]MBE8714517.1 Na+/H+ antiporter NhaA [Sphingobacterium hungaricum]